MLQQQPRRTTRPRVTEGEMAVGFRPMPLPGKTASTAVVLIFGVACLFASSQPTAAYYCPGITCYADGSCLPLSKRCDGVRDCIDGRDEDDCDVACDLDSEFDCGDGKCINSLQRCDGQLDCALGNDEDHCDVIRHCRPNDFVCDRRRCIPARSRCNGARDCIDGTDEINCKSISCQSTSFACASGDQCIQEWQECDGRHDCRDGSDESSCAKLIKISVSPPAAIVQAGESVRFRCSVKCPGRMQCSIKWSLAGDEPLPREARQHGNVLTLSRVAPWSSADYVCIVAEAPGKSASARLLVRQTVPPAALQQAPADQRGRECELVCPVGHYYNARASESCVPCTCSSRQYCDPCSGVCVDCSTVVSAAGRKHCDRLVMRNPSSSAADKTCDARGTADGRSSPRGGACACKANVMGQWCDECKGGTFFLSKDNPDGCIACVCSGVSSSCVSSALQRTKLTTVFGPTTNEVEFFGQESLPAGYQVVTVDTARGQLQADLAYLPRRHAHYWKLPQKYLGNRLVAYGGFLQFSVEYVPMWDTLTSKTARVILSSSNEQRLFAKLGDNVDVSTRGNSRLHAVKVQLTEHSWRFASGAAVSRRQFLQALANITELLIEAAVASDSVLSISKLGNVSVDVAGGREHVLPGYRAVGSDAEMQLDSVARQVEQCTCPPGYAGLSCEICMAGYYRRPFAPWGACVKCHCNGHSDRCDPATGDCIGCRQGTEGRQCERCSNGWSGDARLGACLPPRHQSGASAAAPVTASNGAVRGGLRVLEDRVIVSAGDAAVLTCEYAGRGVELTWTRLGGGALPQTARQAGGRLIITRADGADAGRYVCVARTTQATETGGGSLAYVGSVWADLVVEATPNCPPCSRHGSRAATSGPAVSGLSCSCRCKRFAEGRQCDRCIEGYFDLHQENEDGCRPCYCSGRSQNCSSSSFSRYQKRILTLDTSNRVEVVQRNGADGGVRPTSAGGGTTWVASGLDTVERRIARPLRLFWSLPPPFLGYQGDAYGGHLEYSVEYLAGPQRVRDIDAELVSHDTRVHHLLAEIPPPGIRTTVRIPMTEQSWRTTAGGPLSRADFMRLLANVTTLLVRSTYARSVTESRLHDPRLSGARLRLGGGSEAREVELCLCPPEYAGASCQDCAEGYQRSRDGTCFREKAQPTFQTARTQPTPAVKTTAALTHVAATTSKAPQMAEFSPSMKDSVVAVGMAGSLVCPSSWPDASYTWTREGGFPLPQGVVTRGRELLVLNATTQLDGWYTCRISSRYGSQIVTARINVVPLLWSPRRITAPSGSEVVAECLATGQPTGNLLYWQSPRGHKVTVATPTRSLLKFGHVTMGHAGHYTCMEVSGSTVVSSSVTEINVKLSGEGSGTENHRQRRHALSNFNVNSKTGADVTLRCHGDIDLKLHEPTWLRAEGLPLPTHSRSAGGSLFIDDVRDVDAGQYKCMSGSSDSTQQQVCGVYLVVIDGVLSHRGRN